MIQCQLKENTEWRTQQNTFKFEVFHSCPHKDSVYLQPVSTIQGYLLTHLHYYSVVGHVCLFPLRLPWLNEWVAFHWHTRAYGDVPQMFPGCAAKFWAMCEMYFGFIYRYIWPLQCLSDGALGILWFAVYQVRTCKEKEAKAGWCIFKLTS